MRNTGLEETQDGIKIAGRNINNLRYADDTILMSESKEELKRLLMKMKEESEKVGLKGQGTKILHATQHSFKRTKIKYSKKNRKLSWGEKTR